MVVANKKYCLHGTGKTGLGWGTARIMHGPVLNPLKKNDLKEVDLDTSLVYR